MTRSVEPDIASLKDVLTAQGVRWPWHGYAPGRYSVPCRRCARRFDGAKGSLRCLPCALKDALDAGTDARAASYAVGYRAGLTAAGEELRRLRDGPGAGSIEIEIDEKPTGGQPYGNA